MAGLLAYVGAGALAGASAGAQQALTNSTQWGGWWNQQRLENQKIAWEQQAKKLEYQLSSNLETQVKQPFEAAQNALNRETTLKAAALNAQGDFLRGGFSQLLHTQAQLKNIVHFVTGDDGQLYGISGSGEKVDLGLKAQGNVGNLIADVHGNVYGITSGGQKIDLGITAPDKVQHLVTGQGGKIYGLTDTGKPIDLGITAPDKVQHLVTGQGGKIYGLTDTGKPIETGITAESEAPTLKETQVGEHGQLIAVMSDGTSKPLSITVPRQDKVTQTFVNDQNRLFALTESGQKIDLGTQVPPKDAPKVQNILTDPATGNQTAVMTDGTELKLTARGEIKGPTLKETQVGPDGRLIGVMTDGTTKDLQRSVPVKDKVSQMVTAKDGTVFAITESGQKVDLGITGETKSQAPAKVHSVETDARTGMQWAVMDDGSKRPLGLQNAIKSADITPAEKARANAVENLIKLNRQAREKEMDPTQAAELDQDAMALQVMLFRILHMENPATPTPDNYGKYGVPPGQPPTGSTAGGSASVGAGPQPGAPQAPAPPVPPQSILNAPRGASGQW